MKQFLLLAFIGIVMSNMAGYAQTASATWTLKTSGAPALVGNVIASTIDTSATSTNIIGFSGHSFVDTGSVSGLYLGKSWPADSNTTIADTTFNGIVTTTGRLTARYVQFTISPMAGNTLTIDNISLQVCQNNTSAQTYVAAGYSTDGIAFKAFNTNGRIGNACSATAGTWLTCSTTTTLPTVASTGAVTIRVIVWRHANSTASNTQVYVGNVVVAGTTSPISAVAVEHSTVKSFDLAQNFPNPFNPSTVISYQLPTPGDVHLTVYNSIGSEVAKLVDEMQPAGQYSVPFNAANFPSGAYYYHLQVGAFIKTGKMILAK